MDMRISSVYNAYSVQPSRGTTQTSRAASGRSDTDRVSLSAQAGDYQAARNAISAAPDIRESITGRIKDMLDTGTYRVTPQEVAASILRV